MSNFTPKYPHLKILGTDEGENMGKTDDNKQSRSRGLDDEISIKVKPKMILKGVVYVVILLLVFGLGRWTAGPTVMTEEVVVEEPVKENSFSLSNFLTAFLSGEPKAEEKMPTAEAEEVPEEPATVAEEMPAEEPETPTGATVTEEEEDEYVLASYEGRNLKLTFKPIIQWVGPKWGKIIKIDFTLTNNEGGTLKPTYFLLYVEGYPDLEKKIPLPSAAQEVKSHTQLSTVVDVPGSFAYNQVTAGDLTDLLVNLVLYDAKGKIITSFADNFNLQG